VTFVPTFLINRAKVWSLNRQLETQAQTHVANAPGPLRREPAIDPELPPA
jgi:hypothetical protein